MLRVRVWEGGGGGSIQWRRVTGGLASARRRSVYLARAIRRAGWLQSHMPTVVLQLVDASARIGISKRRTRAR
eukprot:10608807-Lingulodinium_polyedra.AAC.1